MPAVIEIGRAAAEDAGAIRAFFASRPPLIRLDREQIFAAREGERVVGAARLCTENGVLVLRGMLVDEAFQRQGIGRRLLQAMTPAMDGQPCYCLPYPHLVDFYGTAGFRQIPVPQAPPHLQQRIESYVAMGLELTLMERPARIG